MRLHVHWWHKSPEMQLLAWVEEYRVCRCGALQQRIHIWSDSPWTDVEPSVGDALLHRLNNETIREGECPA